MSLVGNVRDGWLAEQLRVEEPVGTVKATRDEEAGRAVRTVRGQSQIEEGDMALAVCEGRWESGGTLSF